MLPKTSQYGNVPFRCDRQPFAGLLFDELDSGRWRTVVVAGPSQSGKTLCGFVIPILRDVAELKLNTIAAFPEADMAADKWDSDFLPTLRESPELSSLIPTTGPGARGGRIKDRISLGNGVDIKIMSRGGKDTAKAGYTSPRVHVTEAAGWSHSSENSKEANPLRQLRARMKSFKRDDPRRCLIVEGTLTVEDELPWSARGEDDDEKYVSTRSRILSPCPHCGEWVLPDRKDLIGWQDAESEDEAANEARWLCPACSHPFTNETRQKSVAQSRLVHAGQTVNEHGEVVGDPPPTSTLWFHWVGWHNLLRDTGDFGEAEWMGDQGEEGTQDREDAQKELAQFDFSHVFKSSLADHEPLKATAIRKRSARDLPQNVIPADTVKLTVGVDIGDWTGWWFAIAWRENGVAHVPGYGAFDIKRSKNDDLATRIVAALDEFADDVIEQGFPQEGGEGFRVPDEVWVDGGYRPDDVADFLRPRGKFWKNRFKLCRGRGKSTTNGGYNHRSKATQQTPKIGTQWYMEPNYDRRIPEITFNADYWKLYVDERLRAEAGKRGSLVFFRGDLKNQHAKVSNHLANEQFQRVWEPGKGLVEKWVVTGDQHWKDCAAMACAAGDAVGFRLQEIEQEEDQVGESPTSEDTATKGDAPSCWEQLLSR